MTVYCERNRQNAGVFGTAILLVRLSGWFVRPHLGLRHGPVQSVDILCGQL